MLDFLKLCFENLGSVLFVATYQAFQHIGRFGLYGG